MQIVYLGPLAEIEIAETGDLVELGQTVDVPDEVAGRPPKGKPGTRDYDAGEGLLAQTLSWAKSTTKAAKAVAAASSATEEGSTDA